MHVGCYHGQILMTYDLFLTTLGTAGQWHDIGNSAAITYTHPGMTLNPGGRYSMKVGAVNKAGAITTFETDGVVVDDSAPVVCFE